MERILKGLAAELRPLPLVATLTAVIFACLLAGNLPSMQALLYIASIFFLLITVHALDTYEDHYVTKEDAFKKFAIAHGSNGLLSKEELLSAAAICSAAFIGIIAYLSMQSGPIFFLLSIAAYMIAVSYSRYLSRQPVISLLSYPSGLILAMSAAYLLGNGLIGSTIISYEIPIFLLFLGASVWIAIVDVETDRISGKQNLGLWLGIDRSKTLALAFFISGLLVSVLLSYSFVSLLSAVLLAILFYRATGLPPQKGVRTILACVFAFVLLQIILYFMMSR